MNFKDAERQNQVNCPITLKAHRAISFKPEACYRLGAIISYVCRFLQLHVCGEMKLVRYELVQVYLEKIVSSALILYFKEMCFPSRSAKARESCSS
jgi:hypothetical protein